MSLVENELTIKNIERARTNNELLKYREIEQKLTPSDPECFAELFMAASTPIEQIYLSSPDDEFNLRVRCAYTPDGPFYTATQKDRGVNSNEALERSEITTEITSEAFSYYQSMGNLPHVQKLRTEIAEGVTVDFYNDEEFPVVVEIEHGDPAVRAQLLESVQEMVGTNLTNRSLDPSFTTEAIAHRLSGERGKKSPESLDTFTEKVFREMIAEYVTGKNQVVVGLTGMSGSGKTTVTHALQEQVAELFGEEFRPIVISTDDYHFGKAKLEERYGAPYTDWDSSRTYNTAELAVDLEQISKGAPLIKRHFDFDREEPVFDEKIKASPFVIIEGLYAGSKDLDKVRTLHFELPTSIATSIGRDLRRLIIDDRANRVFPTPESRLRYQIETAVPLYFKQEQPIKRSFSASSRPLAERAFMLSRLS